MSAGGVEQADAAQQLQQAGATPILGYGRSRRSYWRVVRVALLLVAGAGVVAAAWWAKPRIALRLRVLGQQAALMGLSREAGTVVWEEETVDAAMTEVGPKRAGGYELRLIRRPGGGADKTASFLPEAPRAEFDAASGVQQWDFTAFAHPRSALGGKARLVMVCGAATTWGTKGEAGKGQAGTGAAGPGESGRKVFLVPMVIEPGSLIRAPRPAVRQAGLIGLDLHFDDTFRLFAGQSDRSDASRFTIEYECNGVRGELEGTLCADGALTIVPVGANPPPKPWHLDAMSPAGSKRRPAGPAPVR